MSALWCSLADSADTVFVVIKVYERNVLKGLLALRSDVSGQNLCIMNADARSFQIVNVLVSTSQQMLCKCNKSHCNIVRVLQRHPKYKGIAKQQKVTERSKNFFTHVAI